MRSFLFAANWKMYLSTKEEVAFCIQHKNELIELASLKNRIALFPSSISATQITDLFNNTPIAIGAQDCSDHAKGAYTGQIAARSLAEVGCSFCIVGHSERRQYGCETDQIIAQKVARLLEQHICPIICVGETRAEYEAKQTLHVLDRQLAPIIKTLASYPQALFHVAYEPVWAIGTGHTATNQEIHSACNYIQKYINKKLPKATCSLLYGGSITAKTAPVIKQIPDLGGFLIGGASIDFQEFKNIVLSDH